MSDTTIRIVLEGDGSAGGGGGGGSGGFPMPNPPSPDDDGGDGGGDGGGGDDGGGGGGGGGGGKGMARRLWRLGERHKMARYYKSLHTNNSVSGTEGIDQRDEIAAQQSIMERYYKGLHTSSVSGTEGVDQRDFVSSQRSVMDRFYKNLHTSKVTGTEGVDQKDFIAAQRSKMRRFYENLHGGGKGGRGSGGVTATNPAGGKPFDFSGIAGSRLGAVASAFGAFHSAGSAITSAAGGDAVGTATGGAGALGFGAAAMTGNPVVAGATAAFVGLTSAVGKANEEFEKTARHLGRYSGQIAAGNAQADIIRMQSDMASAARLGPELAENRILAAKADSMMQRYGDEIQSVMLKIHNTILRAVAGDQKVDLPIDKLRNLLALRAPLPDAAAFGGKQAAAARLPGLARGVIER